MKYIVVSRIMDGSTLKGFALVSETGSVNFVKLDVLQATCESGQSNVIFDNAIYNKEFKTLEGTQGSLSKYPTIDSKFNIVGKNGLCVLKTILDSVSKKPVGCVCFTATGVKYNLSYKRMSDLVRQGSINCNFDFKTVDNIKMAVPKKGGSFDCIIMETPRKGSVYDSSKGEEGVYIDNGLDSLPTVKAYGLDKVYASDLNKSVDEKMMRATMNLQKLAPFYFCIYQAIKKKPAVGLGTLGVTEDTLYYDISFISSLSVAELTFVLIHEMCHIAMQHAARFKGKDNHDLWNIATDLYINSIICSDFDISFGETEKEFKGTALFNGKEVERVAVIKTPSFGVFIETQGGKIDLSRETPESIYNQLVKENQNYGQSSQSGQQGNSGQQGQQGQQSQGQSGQQGNSGQQGQQGQQSQGQQGQQGQSQQTQGQSGQPSQGQSSQGQQSKGQQTQGQSGQGQQGQDSSNNQGGNSSGDFSDSSQGNELSNGESKSGTGDLDGGSGSEGQFKEVSVTYNGKKLTGKIMKDVMSNVDGKDDDRNTERIESTKNILSRISTNLKLEAQKGNLSDGFSKTGGSLTKRHIEAGLASGVDWRVILRNVCAKKPKKIFTLAQPNQDYMNLGITLADRRRLGKPTEVSDIKIAIDVSGSVSEKDLNWYLSEINNLFNEFDASGELLYWSTQVGDAGDFHSMKDLVKVQPKSTGGTDVKCVFDYLCRKEKTMTGKIADTPPRDIKCLIIITDGYFDINFKDYERYFGRKTVWLITGNRITTKIPFGEIYALEDDPKRKN